MAGIFIRYLIIQRSYMIQVKKIFSGKSYEYCVFPYNGDATHLVKALGRLSGAAGNIKLEIFYGEVVSGNWGKLSTLSDQQREKLGSFIADSENDFQIIE